MLAQGLPRRSPWCKLGPTKVMNVSRRRSSHRCGPPAAGPLLPSLQPGSRRLFLLPTPSRRRAAVGCSFFPSPPAAGRPFRGSSPPSRPAPRGRAVPPGAAPPRLPSSGRRSAPPRAGSVPTSGYRLQPPRLWHYGHGGGDGSAEAEPAGHQGAGTVSAPSLRGLSAPSSAAAGGRRPREEAGPGAGGARCRPALPEPQPLVWLRRGGPRGRGAPRGWAERGVGVAEAGGWDLSGASAGACLAPEPQLICVGGRRRPGDTAGLLGGGGVGSGCQGERAWERSLPGPGDWVPPGI